jgi:glycosyl transferase family 87
MAAKDTVAAPTIESGGPTLRQLAADTRAGRVVAVAVPAAVAVAFLAVAASQGKFAANFERTFWPAGRDVLHGRSPFPPATREALFPGTAFVYPAPAALLMAPFAVLPLHVAAVLFTVLLAGCGVLALYLVGVRDWRCYCAVLLWFTVLSELQKANLTLLLALGAALVWRFRNRAVVAGVAAGAFGALKILLWPLVVWLFAARRYTAGLVAVASGVVLTFGSWAVLGFAGLGDYVPTVRLLSRLERDEAYSPYAVALKLGVGTTGSQVLGLVLAAAVLAAAVVLARRGDERRSFVLALSACILFSPIVWIHYFALLVVALGVLQPRFGLVWLLPILAVGPPRPDGPSWWALVDLAIWSLVLGLAMRRPIAPDRPVVHSDRTRTAIPLLR